MISEKTICINDSSGTSAFAPAEGYFFLYGVLAGATGPKPQCYYFASCRESFHSYLTLEAYGKPRPELFGFCMPKLNVKRLDDFLAKLSDMLGIAHPVIYLTEKKNAIIIRMPRWWFRNTTRMHIMTLFIRGGAYYYDGNDFWSISKYHLALGTMPAIKVFLRGFTRPTYRPSHFSGWVNHFRNLSEEQAMTVLTK